MNSIYKRRIKIRYTERWWIYYSSRKACKKDTTYFKGKKSECSNLSSAMSVGMLSGALVGLPVAFAITLIITIGVVAVVAILKNYRIVVRKSDEEIILEK